jgi:serine/threonine protein kinase
VHDLQCFLLGQVSEEEAQRVEEHLSGCDSCLGALSGLTPSDTVVETIRSLPASAQEPDSGTVAQLIERLEARPPSAADDRQRTEAITPCAGSSPGDATVAPTEGADVAGADATQEIVHLLAPAQGPGEIGRLGGYRVLKLLGVGGMGAVFLAEDGQLGRRVALKVMLPTLAVNPSARQRFLREARAAAAVEHDHVVAIHQVGEERGMPFLAMALLRGESLEERARREGRLPVSEVLRIGREVARGLAAAHEQGLIHRDIKPANVWLEAPGGRVKILDFGLARGAGDTARLTQQGTILGTPSYMAPEQLDGLAVDARADLFSLGVVLYYLATGVLPFTGRDTVSTLMAVSTKEARPPRQLNPDLPPALEALILRLLAKSADGRPPSARAVVEAIAAIESGRPLPAEAAPRRRRIR